MELAYTLAIFIYRRCPIAAIYTLLGLRLSKHLKISLALYQNQYDVPPGDLQGTTKMPLHGWRLVSW